MALDGYPVSWVDPGGPKGKNVELRHSETAGWNEDCMPLESGASRGLHGCVSS
jgi:hypothetical protein